MADSRSDQPVVRRSLDSALALALTMPRQVADTVGQPTVIKVSTVAAASPHTAVIDLVDGLLVNGRARVAPVVR